MESIKKVYVCKLRLYKGHQLMEDELKWVFVSKEKALEKMEWYMKRCLDWDEDAVVKKDLNGTGLGIIQPGISSGWERHYIIICEWIADLK